MGGFWVGALEGGLEATVYSCLWWLHRGGGRRHCVWGAAWWEGQETLGGSLVEGAGGTLQGWVSSMGSGVRARG